MVEMEEKKEEEEGKTFSIIPDETSKLLVEACTGRRME